MYDNITCSSDVEGKPVISMHEVPKQDVIHYGIMTGNWDNKEQTVLKLRQITEKPSVDYAEDYLSVQTKEKKSKYYAVFGQYVLTNEVYDQLGENIKNNLLERGEIQLTTALEQVREKMGMLGYQDMHRKMRNRDLVFQVVLICFFFVQQNF